MSELEELLAQNPGDPAFVEHASSLLSSGRELEAMDVCLAGLSSNPGEHRGRLLLSRIYFSRSYVPFAVQELRVLHRALPENEPIRKLLEKLSLSSESTNLTEGEKNSSLADDSVEVLEASRAEDGQEVTVAESDFDFDELDLIMDED